MPACALAARKNFVLHRSRPDERADQVRNDVTMRCMVFTLTFDSSPIKGEGIPSVVLYCCCRALWMFVRIRILRIMGDFQDWDDALHRFMDSRLRGNDGPVWLVCLVFTLTFDSSPIKGEGIPSVVLYCCCPAHPAPLDCGSSPQ